MGAAEDGRAPTEERSCVRGWDFFSTLLYVTLLLANTFLAINSVLALSVLVLMNSFKKRNRARASSNNLRTFVDLYLSHAVWNASSNSNTYETIIHS